MKYKSEIYEVVHQDATAMHEIGAISEDKMREFDKMCLVPEPSTETRKDRSSPLTNETVETTQKIMEPINA